MTRTGKIARLPRDIRNQLNRRIADGEPGTRLVGWLNSLPQVMHALAEGFGGREINEQNLCEWKQRGYQEWVARQEMLVCARELAGDAAEVASTTEGSLAEHLSVILSARYAMLVSGWNGETDETFRREARTLRALCQDIVELRRGDQNAERLRLDLDRFEEMNKADEVRALETVIEEVKQWPDVQQSFKDAFALLRRRKGGQPGVESNQIKPNQTCSERTELNHPRHLNANLPA